MNTSWRALLILEMLICFGPVGVTVALGCILVPLWLVLAIMPVVAIFGGPLVSQPWLTFWSSIVSALLAIGGALGLVAVFLTTISVLDGRALLPSHRKRVIKLGLCGFLALVGFQVSVGGPKSTLLTGEGLPALFVYIVLPSLGAMHLIYLARHSLFSREA